ncbi:MAG TPA: hypothetical protein VNR66_10470 [Solirubrobacteraceae bacterium]|nr:hypothetical protein [Solirubrobacteraceae bacterium]
MKSSIVAAPEEAPMERVGAVNAAVFYLPRFVRHYRRRRRSGMMLDEAWYSTRERLRAYRVPAP